MEDHWDNKDRSSYQFSSHAQSAFAFLKARGFRCTDSTDYLVSYASESVTVTITHDHYSYELNVEFSAHKIWFSLADVMKIQDDTECRKFRNPMASNGSSVSDSLPKLAYLVVKYCEQALSGHYSYYKFMEKARNVWVKQQSDTLILEQKRESANQAFLAGDYRVAFELFSQIVGRLQPSELKKMKISKDNMNPQQKQNTR